jgi:hypothetical protein
MHLATMIGTGAFVVVTFSVRALGFSETGRSLLRSFF